MAALAQFTQRSARAATGHENKLPDFHRRITQEHRLIYRARDSGVEIAACRFHYGKD